MEQADATSRKQWLVGHALVRVAWALACALSALNKAGFIHGDLKPHNTMSYAKTPPETRCISTFMAVRCSLTSARPSISRKRAEQVQRTTPSESPARLYGHSTSSGA
eukprot:2029565-Amphidinium_carterae.2